MTGLERALKQNTDNSTVMVTMEDVVERFIHPSVLKIIGWLNGFPLRVVDDSIFAENIFDEPMKNGKPCIVFYAGKNGFGSQEYYEEQLIRGIMLAKDHPALHNDIMEKVDGVHSEDFGKRLAVFAASFELQEELFKVEGNIRGILYVRQSAAALKRKAIEEGQSELHHVHDVTFR
jgi:hypothetical protein